MACAHMWAVAQHMGRGDILDHLMPCDAFYRDDSNMAPHIQDKTPAVSQATEVSPRFATKESRRREILQACTVMADIACESAPHSEAFHRFVTESIEKYRKEICSSIGDTAHYYPNPQVHGKKQNQKRKQPITGPTTVTAHKRRRDAKKQQKNQGAEKAKRLTGFI
jgi:hypothetical protein